MILPIGNTFIYLSSDNNVYKHKFNRYLTNKICSCTNANDINSIYIMAKDPSINNRIIYCESNNSFYVYLIKNKVLMKFHILNYFIKNNINIKIIINFNFVVDTNNLLYEHILDIGWINNKIFDDEPIINYGSFF
jgi:hypothetical protein